MNILVINCGSSSIKYALYQDASTLLASGQTESIPSLLKTLNVRDVQLVGHRIVHGGVDFRDPTLITDEVREKLGELYELDPQHNRIAMEAIDAIRKWNPKVKQIAIFDTAFHQTMPMKATLYPGPYEWYLQGIQRFGFHGISYQYCMQRGAELLKKNASKLKMVICHLGSGASLCAIDRGHSIDTTMGFTPLEGLMMDTRSGSFDPSIIFYLLDVKKKDLRELIREVHEKSGLLGISGTTRDMREILEQKDERAKLAFEMYLHRLNASIGSMIASLRGIDVLIFTGGIGENTSLLRERVCANFSFLGIQLGDQKESDEDRVLSSKESSVEVLLIHTNESLEIARQCWKV